MAEPRRRGRPTSALTTVLPNVRANPEELEEWLDLADLEGRTFSNWARRALQKAAAAQKRRNKK